MEYNYEEHIDYICEVFFIHFFILSLFKTNKK
jgi:hypothetical protein